MLVLLRYVWSHVTRMVSEKWCSDVPQCEQMWNNVYMGRMFSLFRKKGKECLLAKLRQSAERWGSEPLLKGQAKLTSGAATQLAMPNLCILRAYLLSGVHFKHRWYESCRWLC